MGFIFAHLHVRIFSVSLNILQLSPFPNVTAVAVFPGSLIPIPTVSSLLPAFLVHQCFTDVGLQLIAFGTAFTLFPLPLILFPSSFLDSQLIESRDSDELFLSVDHVWETGLVRRPVPSAPPTNRSWPCLSASGSLRCCEQLHWATHWKWVPSWLCLSIKVPFGLECWKLLLYLETSIWSSRQILPGPVRTGKARRSDSKPQIWELISRSQWYLQRQWAEGGTGLAYNSGQRLGWCRYHVGSQNHCTVSRKHSRLSTASQNLHWEVRHVTSAHFSLTKADPEAHLPRGGEAALPWVRRRELRNIWWTALVTQPIFNLPKQS